MKWSLKRLALAAEIVGAIGIIISLIYVGNEVSKNTANIELSNHLSILNRLDDVRMSIMESDDLGLIIDRGNSDPTELAGAELSRYNAYAKSWFNTWETAYFINRGELMSTTAWEGWDRATCNSSNVPGLSAFWQEVRDTDFLDVFVKHVDACLLE